jgi:hypothetical protein
MRGDVWLSMRGVRYIELDGELVPQPREEVPPHWF